MVYAKAITLLEDLPSLVEIGHVDDDSEIDLQMGSLNIDISEQQPHGLRTLNQNIEVKQNPYYDEVIKTYPQIQRKIREFSDPDPYQTYMQNSIPIHSPIRYKHKQMITSSRLPHSESKVEVYENYQHKNNTPAVVKQNYMNQSMIPKHTEQHMPVAQERQLHYNANQSYGRNYPVVQIEDYTNLNCKDLINHIDSCPVCSILHRKNDKIYIGIIIVLALLIFLLVWKLNR